MPACRKSSEVKVKNKTNCPELSSLRSQKPVPLASPGVFLKRMVNFWAIGFYSTGCSMPNFPSKVGYLAIKAPNGTEQGPGQISKQTEGLLKTASLGGTPLGYCC